MPTTPSEPQSPDEFDKLVSIKDAAERLNCPVKLLRRKLDQSRLSGVRDGKFWTFRLGDLMDLVWGEKPAQPHADEPRRPGSSPASAIGKTPAESSAAKVARSPRPPISASARQPRKAAAFPTPTELPPDSEPVVPRDMRPDFSDWDSPASVAERQRLAERQRTLEGLVETLQHRASVERLNELLRRDAEEPYSSPKPRRLPPEKRHFRLAHNEQHGAFESTEQKPIHAKTDVSTISENDEKFCQKVGQNQNLNCLNIKGTSRAIAAVEVEKVDPFDASLILQKAFRRHARRLAPNDPSTQDDLIQEMSLGVLECTEQHCLKYFLKTGVSRAINYLEYENQRGMISLDAVADRAVDGPSHPDTLLVRWLLRNNATVAEIEETLGVRVIFEDRPTPRRIFRGHESRRRSGA